MDKQVPEKEKVYMEIEKEYGKLLIDKDYIKDMIKQLNEPRINAHKAHTNAIYVNDEIKSLNRNIIIKALEKYVERM